MKHFEVDDEFEEKAKLDNVLGNATPNHFYRPSIGESSSHVNVDGGGRDGRRMLASPASNARLDSIDRFTMVRSRIV